MRINLILGDQLDRESPLFKDWGDDDLALMIELRNESEHVWSHKTRSALFLSAMRHFHEGFLQDQFNARYYSLGDHDYENFEQALTSLLPELKADSLRLVFPGDYRIKQHIESACAALKIPFEWMRDSHFLSSPEEFLKWSEGKKQLRMEFWYRHLRQCHRVLMDGDEPEGGQWNYDKDNRQTFGKQGPGMLATPLCFDLDDISLSAIKDVESFFSDHPGDVDLSTWPVTREQALTALDDFIQDRLPVFGAYQDAMWTGEAFLYHSRLSAALNLKLLHPMEVIRAAEQAYRDGHAPINSVEGFIRQIIGWREYVRGLYWRHMPDWLEVNALDAHQTLPDFYWTADTDMQCLQQTLSQTLRHGYAHHIQRLMVTGLFSLLLGVKPQAIHEWYLAVYVDAVEWVELPNTVGMSQYADGGIMASKPYVASGKYIQRMSNYCDHCRYKPDQKTGENACPFTVLYWNFLQRHRQRFARHPRTSLQWKHLERMDENELLAIREQAEALRQRWA